MGWRREILVGLSLLIAVSAWGDPGRITSLSMNPPLATTPLWMNETVAHVTYSVKNDARKRSDFQKFAINEDGRIAARELLRLAQVPTKAQFLKRFGDTHQTGDPEIAYRTVTSNQIDAALAALALVRIVDEESMKMKLPPNPSDERVRYLVRSILVRNAVEMGTRCTREIVGRRDGLKALHEILFRSPEDLGSICVEEREVVNACGSRYHAVDGTWLRDLYPLDPTEDIPDTVLYAWLVHRVNGGWAKFTPDWNYGAPELAPLLERIVRLEPGTYPSDPIIFPKLPNSVDEFSQTVGSQLAMSHRNWRRAIAWQRLLGREYPDLAWQNVLALTVQEIDAQKALYAQKPAQVQDAVVTFAEIELAGTAAPDASKALADLVAAKESSARKELVDGSKPDGSTDAALQQKVLGWRAGAPGEWLAALQASFATQIQSGDLRVGVTYRSIRRVGQKAPPVRCVWQPVLEAEGCPAPSIGDQDPTQGWLKLQPQDAFANGEWDRIDPCSTEGETACVYFGNCADPQESMAILPVHKLKGAVDLPVGTLKFVALQKIDTLGARRALDVNDPALESAIEKNIQQKNSAWILRDLSYRLFKRNPVQIETDTSADPSFPYPSLNADPRRMAEALFPETLYPLHLFSQALRDQFPIWVCDNDGSRPDLGSCASERQEDSSGRSTVDLKPYAASTLDEHRLQLRVWTLSTAGFEAAMNLTNPMPAPKPIPTPGPSSSVPPGK